VIDVHVVNRLEFNQIESGKMANVLVGDENVITSKKTEREFFLLNDPRRIA